MQDLSNSLTDRNPKTKLHVLRGSPQSVLPILFKEWRISHLVYEKDTAEYAAVRDRQINALASHAGIKVFGVLGHTLYDPEAAVKANGGKATMSLSSWRAVRAPALLTAPTSSYTYLYFISQAVKGLPPPPRPLPAPDILPPAGDPGFSSLAISQDSVSLPAVDLNSADRVRDVSCYGMHHFLSSAEPFNYFEYRHASWSQWRFFYSDPRRIGPSKGHHVYSWRGNGSLASSGSILR